MEPRGRDGAQPSGVGTRFGGTRAPSVGKYATPSDSPTGATRDQQIVATFGNPCPSTPTSRKIERPQQRGTNTQGDAFSSRPQEAKTASNCSSVTIQRAFCLECFLFTELPETFWENRLV